MNIDNNNISHKIERLWLEESTGNGDDEPDVDHTHGPGEQFADSSNNWPVFNVVVKEVNI